MMEMGRGGACVPARVVLQGRIHRQIPRAQCVFCMETPLCGRSGGHTGTAPTVSFEQIVHGTVDFVWVDCEWVSASTQDCPSRAHLLFIRCRDGTFIRRGKGGFHFYLYLCKQ